MRFQANEAVEVYAGIENIFEQEPDIGQTTLPVGPEGRTFYVGMKAALGSLVD